MQFIRCFLFDVFYFLWTIFFAIFMMWSLLLPADKLKRVVRFYFFIVYQLERFFLGLDYEVRGLENLPKDESYIIASKHQSTYETLKVFLIFDYPSIVLKKELVDLPFWGLYPKKLGWIGIDRSDRKTAIQSLVDGVQRVKDEGQKLLVFPQGTRVFIDETPKEKPYKKGIVKMYAASGLKVVPVAINAGYFWPRNSFLKRSGRVVFEILPPIDAGLSDADFSNKLQDVIEDSSLKLLAEAQENYPG